MPKKKKYRLQVLLNLKERAKRRCELALAKALRELSEEQARLKKLEVEKKKIEERIVMERYEMQTEVSTGRAKMKDPQVRLNFIQGLQEDLEAKKREIEEQKETIRQAEIKVQRCRQDYILAAQDLNVMEKHKELWEKKEARRLNGEEAKTMNELGQVIHQMGKMGHSPKP